MSTKPTVASPNNSPNMSRRCHIIPTTRRRNKTVTTIFAVVGRQRGVVQQRRSNMSVASSYTESLHGSTRPAWPTTIVLFPIRHQSNNQQHKISGSADRFYPAVLVRHWLHYNSFQCTGTFATFDSTEGGPESTRKSPPNRHRLCSSYAALCFRLSSLARGKTPAVLSLLQLP